MKKVIEELRARLDCLTELNRLIMNATQPDDLLPVILESTIRLCFVEACSIALVDEASQQLVITSTRGGAPVEEMRLELGQGFLGSVAQTGEALVCNDVSKDSRFCQEVDRKTGFVTRSLICAPLIQHGRSIGAIEALNTSKPDGFTPEDVQLLTAFGAMASTAIDYAKVFTVAQNTNLALQQEIQDRYSCIVGKSGEFQAALDFAKSVAPTNATVLLLGESGTGKEVLAHAIHQWSPRAAHPFIAVNCVALSEELMESELFGHEKGSFTGAIAQKKGKFELADGGTIFLDEIGELTPKFQTKLLRVLQEREFQRVGGTKDIRVNVRVIAATNRDLQQAMQSGAFRTDLYYRLNVVRIELPPLRDRKQDIPELVSLFIDRCCRDVKRPRMGIDPPAMDLLMAHTWPGNVRELHNAIERAVVLCRGPNIMETDLPIEIRQTPSDLKDFCTRVLLPEQPQQMAEAIDGFKRALIRKTLETVGGDQTRAASILGLQRSNLSRLMKRLELR